MKSLFVGLCVTVAAVPALGAIEDPHLPGNVRTDGWNFAQVVNPSPDKPYGSFGSTALWANPIESNAAGGFDAQFNKTAGYGYATGYSIYPGAGVDGVNLYGGSFSVKEPDAITNVKNVVFQLDILEAHGYDFHDHALPALSYNGGTQGLASNESAILSQVYSGTFPNPQTGANEPLYLNTWLLQWDLSGVSGPINSFEIDWSTVMHAQMYNARLDQSDVYAPAPVPEPAMLGLLSLGGLVLLRRRCDA